MKKREWKESPEIEGHFKIINTDLYFLHSRIGDIDFRRITLDQAQKLFDSGSPYIEKIEPVKRSKVDRKEKDR